MCSMRRVRNVISLPCGRLVLRRYTGRAAAFTASGNAEANASYEVRRSAIVQNPSPFYPSLSEARLSLPAGTTLLRVPVFKAKFIDTDPCDSGLYSIEGKVRSIRRAGKALCFIDIEQDDQSIQFMASNRSLNITGEIFDKHISGLKKGDHISGVGNATRTRTGELSLRITQEMRILAPCLSAEPSGFVDRGLINANRVTNYIIDPRSRQPIMVRAWTVNAIRSFLNDRNFTEVSTPIFSGPGSGALAAPFTTTVNALGSEEKSVHMRVAPELWLKRLVISGFHKVFEIGPSFRNEGIDASHNPEFYTCEFYQSHIDLQQLMETTEDMLKTTYENVFKRCESSGFQESLAACAKLRALSSPALKYEFIPTLELRTGKALPQELSTKSLAQYCEDVGLKVMAPSDASLTPARILDALSSQFLESLSLEHANTPVMIYNQPEIMLPLAKSVDVIYHDQAVRVSKRFELFINGKEYVNAYEEENSPFEQRAKFVEQESAKGGLKDEEALVPDWKYTKSMEWGLPPTGGFGCGIDRLAMLFSGSEKIDDVITFGNVRDVTKQ